MDSAIRTATVAAEPPQWKELAAPPSSPEPAFAEVPEVTEAGLPHDILVPVKLEEIAAATIMAVLAMITLANVATRYVIDVSFAFTEEYSVVLLMVLVFVGVSSAIAKNAHIRVTFFIDQLAARARRRLEIVGCLAMLVCFAVLVYYGARLTLDAREIGETSPGLGNPQWLYLMWLPILSAAAFLRTVGALVRLLRRSRPIG
jgi:TRAP-type C4-dicarboxylate transport system permease small subunit